MKPTKTATVDYANLYAQVQAAQGQKESAKDGGSKDYLKPKPGNTYLVKIVPFVKDLTKTFVEFEFHGWESVKNGQYVTTGACPRDLGGKCPVCEVGYSSYTRNEQYKGDRKSKLLLRRKTSMTNVYVIDDPVNPENNGTVKVLRYGSVVAAKIHDVVLGDEKDEIGPFVFDYTKSGATLKIICDKKGGSNSVKSPPTYERTKWATSGSKIDMNPAQIAEIFEQAKDLTTLIPKTKNDAEIRAILATHFSGEEAPAAPAVSDDDLQGDDNDSGPLPSGNGADIDIDPEVQRLLEGLNK